MDDIAIDLHEEKGCLGPCSGCVEGCIDFWCCCTGCVRICCSYDPSTAQQDDQTQAKDGGGSAGGAQVCFCPCLPAGRPLSASIPFIISLPPPLTRGRVLLLLPCKVQGTFSCCRWFQPSRSSPPLAEGAAPEEELEAAEEQDKAVASKSAAASPAPAAAAAAPAAGKPQHPAARAAAPTAPARKQKDERKEEGKEERKENSPAAVPPTYAASPRPLPKKLRALAPLARAGRKNLAPLKGTHAPLVPSQAAAERRGEAATAKHKKHKKHKKAHGEGEGSKKKKKKKKKKEHKTNKEQHKKKHKKNSVVPEAPAAAVAAADGSSSGRDSDAAADFKL